MMQQSLEYYESNKLYAIFPMVDTMALKRLLDANELGLQGGTIDAANQACLTALTAFVTRIRHHEPTFTEADSSAYMQAVLSMLPQLVMEHTNIRALEAVLILVGSACYQADYDGIFFLTIARLSISLLKVNHRQPSF